MFAFGARRVSELCSGFLPVHVAHLGLFFFIEHTCMCQFIVLYIGFVK